MTSDFRVVKLGENIGARVDGVRLGGLDAETAAAALKAQGARHIYLAGQPGKTETTYRDAGVQTFIHAGCDAPATLQAAYQILAG